MADQDAQSERANLSEDQLDAVSGGLPAVQRSLVDHITIGPPADTNSNSGVPVEYNIDTEQGV